MKIEIELDDKYIDILAQENGYQEKITEPTVEKDENGIKRHSFKEIANPLSKEEFLSKAVADRFLSQIRAHVANERTKQINEEVSHQINPTIIKTKNK